MKANIGIDFDGTCIPQIPSAGVLLDEDKDLSGAEEVLKLLVKRGHTLYLWSCRSRDPRDNYNKYLDNGTCLDEALSWFKERNIPIKTDYSEVILYSQKPFFNLIIDDTALGTKLKPVIIKYRPNPKSDPNMIKKVESYCVDWDWVKDELKSLSLI